MALGLGIAGEPNSGKSYSRHTIVNGEEVFVIEPSRKVKHVTTSDNKPIKSLSITSANAPTTQDMVELLAKNGKITSKTINSVMGFLLAQPAGYAEKNGITIAGNYTLAKLNQVIGTLNFIDKCMPHIKTIIISDFSHFLSEILANKEFIERKQGGDAYQRFWELAGETLRNLTLSINALREDLVVVTEYHVEYNDESGLYEIFVPGGKMLKEKFKLESYYDHFIYTQTELNEDGTVKSYNFVTERIGKFNARCCQLFDPTVIPNDLQLVLDKIREYNGI